MTPAQTGWGAATGGRAVAPFPCGPGWARQHHTGRRQWWVFSAVAPHMRPAAEKETSLGVGDRFPGLELD